MQKPLDFSSYRVYPIYKIVAHRLVAITADGDLVNPDVPDSKPMFMLDWYFGINNINPANISMDKAGYKSITVNETSMVMITDGEIWYPADYSMMDDKWFILPEPHCLPPPKRIVEKYIKLIAPQYIS